jgi:hypothetical protein
MPAMCGTVRFSDDDVAVNLRLTIGERHIAEHRKHFDLLNERDFLVIFSPFRIFAFTLLISRVIP